MSVSVDPAICETVSRAFYGGSLRTPDSVRGSRPLERPLHVVDYGRQPETKDGGSLSNGHEANAAVAVVRTLVAHGGHHPRCVAVLCFYNAQRALVERGLDDATRGVLVATVDAVQGREADAVVLCTTRSNASNDLGFVADRRRVNVALSRAKHLLVVLGDRGCLDSDAKAWRPALAAAYDAGLASHASAAEFSAFYKANAPQGYASAFPPPPEPPAPDARDGDEIRALCIDDVIGDLTLEDEDDGPKDPDEPPPPPPPDDDDDGSDDDGDGDAAAKLDAKIAKYTRKLAKAQKRDDQEDAQRLEKKLKKYQKKLARAKT